MPSPADCAQKLGLQRVPVHVATGLTPAQIKAHRLADNQTATLATWDDDALPREVAELQQMGFDLDLTGFSAEQLLRPLEPPANLGLTDPGAIPQPPDQSITERGDLWELGPHRLLCGEKSSALAAGRHHRETPARITSSARGAMSRPKYAALLVRKSLTDADKMG